MVQGTQSNDILTGIDLGPETEKIIAYAAYVASKTGSRIRLLYVIDYLLTPPSYLTSYIDEEKKREESEMSRWKTLLLRQGIEAEYGIIQGRLQESFARAIESVGPRLLVLGFKTHVLRPSSSERLVRSLAVETLVIRGERVEEASMGSLKIGEVLCPVDFSPNSIRALERAREYSRLFGADLRVVHIIPSYLIKEKWGAWKKLEDADREQFDLMVTAEAAAKLAALCKDFEEEPLTEVWQGDPGRMIPALAGEKRSGLIVMGATGVSVVRSVLMGGTTDAVLKSSPCPVIVVR
jgi:nucleotide-binding universal stress UspA family protein